MGILEILRNINLGDNQYNIVGVIWFSLIGLFLYWYYIRCGHEKYRPLMGMAFAINSVLMIIILSDEINLWAFMLTRQDFFTAYAFYWSIPDKLSRFFIVLISWYILDSEKFKHYWNKEGLFMILGVTTTYAIISIFTGMYGWRINDPTNLGKYFYTYVLYYIVFFILVFWLYPNWLQLRLHILRDHPELRKRGAT